MVQVGRRDFAGASGVFAMRTWVLLAESANPAENLSIFDPASPAAESILNLAILVFAITGLIFLIVEGVLFYCVGRFRQGPAEPNGEPPQVYGSQPIEVAWTAAPAIVVFFLLLVTTRTLWEVSASTPSPKPDDETLFVTVTGRQWWWEYTYNEYDGRTLGFTTAGELHIPVSEEGTPRPTHLILESADVCHSFWVPRLAGKMDLIPGRTNHLWLQSNHSGLYVGQCAEYCGTQHANMLLRVVVESRDEFERWLESEKSPAVDEPAARDGRRAFLSESCVNCHRVRGTAAQGTYAPDLTHLMARQTLASGIVENNAENLAEWVRNPQSIKPGCLMPAFGLGNREQALIVQYLLTLR
jgi:cytochrome c oxidase subunit II